ncbi:hypothetical protein [Endozoicomonas sp. YOMI1]|uniref:hypothetical protein n=1 Tax=Endozoicomonas sp. YOMI1 TaxID=2828739 RepID=UPI00214772FF|nr:hypothetical protein [Endozoicomonas sp. YOMI1]
MNYRSPGNLNVQTTTPKPAAPDDTQTPPTPQATAQSSSHEPVAPAPKKVRFLTQPANIAPVKSQPEPLVTNTHNPGNDGTFVRPTVQNSPESCSVGTGSHLGNCPEITSTFPMLPSEEKTLPLSH